MVDYSKWKNIEVRKSEKKLFNCCLEFKYFEMLITH